MGRSLTSCFKIMYCAGDSANYVDGLPQPESKTLPGKRTWSFQKRSFTHHVPSNHVISESVSIVNDKHDLEAAADTPISEKASVSQRDTVEKQTNQTPALPVPSTESELFTSKSTDKFDYNIDEDVVVVIQASIRGYLAKRELEKIRKVVKLQAAIRRYLVRRQAVGTLRCIQAIFKIQQIVRDRAIQSKAFAAKEKLNEETTAEMVKSFEMKPNKTSLAIKKLTSNSFASQLLLSTLETNSIHISCNPLQSDSGWTWLERWMALTSSDQKIIFNQDGPGEDVSTVLSNKIMSNQDDLGEDVNSKFQITAEHMSSDNKLLPCDPTSLRAEVEGDLITNSSEDKEIEFPSSLQDQISNSLVQNLHLKSHNDETWLKNSSDSVDRQIPMISEPVSHFELISHSNIPDYPEETYKNSTKKDDHVAEEMEADHVLTESRKSRNPGFAAVQAKFEELSATSSSTRSLSNTFRDSKSDSKSADVSSKTGEGSETKSVFLNTGDMRKEITTALSDRSEAEISEISSKIRTSKVNACTISITNSSIGDTNVETDDLSCDSDVVLGKIIAKSSENVTSSGNATALVQVEQKSEESISLNTQMGGSTKGSLADRSSQEGSPISHITVPVSNGRSSSLISMHVKTNKAENITPIRKKRPQIAINNSPTDFKNDSSEQTSEENLKKGVTKIAKRRNSFSMVKTDHEHQTSSSNLLPSYMKPTESAKAKVSTFISQKSSPDMHEKDNHVKKRHSLPNGDERQDSSPRMQRSTSQVQHNLKGNGTHSPQNSTERRWIR